MKFQQLEQTVIRWADEKGIFEKSTAEKQKLKCLAEIGELADAIAKDDTENILLEIGDVCVCAINANHFEQQNTYKFFTQNEFYPRDSVLILADILANQASVLTKTTIYGWLFLFHLNHLAHCYNSDLETCLELAYNKISKRTGQMVDGVFVKSEDL